MSSKTPKLEAIQAELAKSVEDIREKLQAAVAKNPNLFGTALIELKLQDGVVSNVNSGVMEQRRPK
jgi:hypothetical protein